MGSKQQVLESNIRLRDQLYALAIDGNYSEMQCEGFARLHGAVHINTEKFFISPAHGDPSPHYDNPRTSADRAFHLGSNCRPDDQSALQDYYDAVHASIAALKSVTKSLPRPLKVAPKPRLAAK